MKHSYHLAYFATHAFMPTFTIIMLCCCGKTDSYKSADYRGNGFTSIVGTDLANNDMSGYVKEERLSMQKTSPLAITVASQDSRETVMPLFQTRMARVDISNSLSR